ncbi:hypothetical protein [Tissierella sp.]|uniref:hypothetical protein n=1 Tax=Tissierella sp. TaxID=41274 RepID=UPI002865D3C0|nr:hypothetical protein [Tissierella sp.]MDR7856318.1 hypothetical protein [Tissierella sp.]
MGQAKNEQIRKMECERICPECDGETLWVENGIGKCENEECGFEGYVRDCVNGCGNVLYEDDEEIVCTDCIKRELED